MARTPTPRRRCSDVPRTAASARSDRRVRRHGVHRAAGKRHHARHRPLERRVRGSLDGGIERRHRRLRDLRRRNRRGAGAEASPAEASPRGAAASSAAVGGERGRRHRPRRGRGRRHRLRRRRDGRGGSLRHRRGRGGRRTPAAAVRRGAPSVRNRRLRAEAAPREGVAPGNLAPAAVAAVEAVAGRRRRG